MLVVKELPSSEFTSDKRLTLMSTASPEDVKGIANQKLKRARLDDLRLKLNAHELGKGKTCGSADTQALCQELIRFCHWKPTIKGNERISVDRVGQSGECVPVKSPKILEILVPGTYHYTHIKNIKVGEQTYALTEWLDQERVNGYADAAEWYSVKERGMLIADGMVLEAIPPTRLIPIFEMQTALLCILSDKCVVLRKHRHDFHKYDIISLNLAYDQFFTEYSAQKIWKVREVSRKDDSIQLQYGTGQKWDVTIDSLKDDLMYICLRLHGYPSRGRLPTSEYINQIFELSQVREKMSAARDAFNPL
jgi:hypothetical protein